MRRVAYVLAVLGILCVAAGQAQAHNPYYHNGYHQNYGYHHAYYGPRVVVAPRVVVPTAICPQPLFYRPVYRSYYPYYAPAPAAGFYYQSRGLSLGIGW
jgi:hypothetical protein